MPKDVSRAKRMAPIQAIGGRKAPTMAVEYFPFRTQTTTASRCTGRFAKTTSDPTWSVPSFSSGFTPSAIRPKTAPVSITTWTDSCPSLDQ